MQIHATLVDATAARLIAAGVCGGNIAKDRDEPADMSELPIAIVHVMADKARADGGPRTGVPDFRHELALCVDVYAKGQSGAGVKGALYAAGEAVLQALLTDAAWLAIGDGVASIEQSYLLPKEGDYITSGLRIELVVLHASVWHPSTTGLPDFETAAIGVDLGGGVSVGAEIELPGE